MTRHLAWLLAIGLFTPGLVAASAPAALLPLDAIVSQQNQIRDAVLAGDARYKDVPQETRNELLQRQQRLLQMIGDRHDPSQLSKAERLEAFNTLEWIEAAVNNESDKRMECSRERRTGSMRTVTVCKTQRQMAEERERARSQMLGTMPLEI